MASTTAVVWHRNLQVSLLMPRSQRLPILIFAWMFTLQKAEQAGAAPGAEASSALYTLWPVRR